jgi:hypothetical protein
VTSGAVCLGVGTSFARMLNVQTISFLVPSLGDVASGMGIDPLLLVTRPQRALHFTIGENTVASPALTIGIEHLEVDFYAFLFERYVRAFTLDLTMNAGVNLEFEQPPGMPAKIKPTLVGISPKDVQLTVVNSEFVRESPDQLAAVLVREDSRGNKRLTAYIVSEEQTADLNQIVRKYLQGKLPEYMVPELFMKLEHLPLTPTGKLDRRALPQPRNESSESAQYLAPGTVVEEVVAAIWADVLGVKLRTMQRMWLEARRWLFEQTESGYGKQSAGR